jgi:hypothetical protein
VDRAGVALARRLGASGSRFPQTSASQRLRLGQQIDDEDLTSLGIHVAGREREGRLQIGILVAAMVLLIQDIDRPGAGFIKVSQQPMANAAVTLAAFPD